MPLTDGRDIRRARRGRSGHAGEANAKAPKAVWPGVRGGRYKPLSPSEEQQVHETALLLLEELGLSQAIPSMIEKVSGAGGRLTGELILRWISFAAA